MLNPPKDQGRIAIAKYLRQSAALLDQLRGTAAAKPCGAAPSFAGTRSGTRTSGCRCV